MPAHTSSPRGSLVARAIWLSIATIGWNLLAAGLALSAWAMSGSLSLGGFGLNTLIDMSASTVLVWRFWKDADDPRAAATLERRAEAAIGLAMLGVAAFLALQALHSIATRSHPESSPTGLGIALASILLLPWLAHAKAQVARGIPSRALKADSILTGASAGLALLTLGALVANTAFGWWWADAAAALVIAAFLVGEVFRAGRTLIRPDVR
jgi:divalent metal cation (Fe/Co/Zn/Cd) transporter